MKNEILDVPLIQKAIHEKHQNFIKEYGSIIEKVMADHRLFTDIILAKLHRIVVIFKEERIIDDIRIIEQGPCKKIVLCKNGYDTYIEIETNGTQIVFRGYTYLMGFDSDFRFQNKTFSGVNEENFNWTDFSIQIIDYIHSTLYERKEVVQTKMQEMLKQ